MSDKPRVSPERVSPRRLSPSIWLLGGLILIAVICPMIPGSTGTISLLLQVFAFGAFAMSYDLLIGYTGIVSFGHAMFFGTGAYAVAIWLSRTEGSTTGLVLGIVTAVVASIILSLLVAFLSLRVRDVYFAMITLAVGEVFVVLAGSQSLRQLTNANDGMSLMLPNWLSGDSTIYYLGLVFLVVVGFFLKRVTTSPVGHILQGIRENEGRADSLGHQVVRWKTAAFIISGVVAALSGVLFAVAQSFVSTSVYDVATVSLNVLLMVVIGGTGTLYGGVLGAALLVFIQNWLTSLGTSIPWLRNDYIVFGILYILVVRFLPKGIIGSLRHSGGRRPWKQNKDYVKSET
ncbi:branched-chain amino acid ABC transporter permease [Alicyclobacillus curvatus]|nr:branched-chain amino acid ABC transporter permease [Alicyclobacillus curvatus]